MVSNTDMRYILKILNLQKTELTFFAGEIFTILLGTPLGSNGLLFWSYTARFPIYNLHLNNLQLLNVKVLNKLFK